jgi:hypothetical protein
MTNKDSHQITVRTQDSIEHNMKTTITYIIVAVPFHADAAPHDDLARKVNEKIGDGYELFGRPFLSEQMMYQSMIKVVDQTPQMRTP